MHRSVFIKLDCGNARCGVPYKDTDLLFRVSSSQIHNNKKILPR